ncbi:carbohydrate kinase [Lysobacter sp. KIS68-7]|uniref:carbohydrate kinase family protein n=1 Tax=Lysobacter sp. KIS68-7 TaxID=2904252 RepID=UPI001E3AE1D5|nr:carbohydrate kinase [Lysobacter sp. KIS68-7]UHQ19029.1 carbohydrate kinase [Lysobacter sp. KIS68-7]
MKIVCFGEALIDFLAQPGGAPDAPRAFLQHAGGAPANVAVAVARLGAQAQFVGMLGADMFGDFLLESLRDAGVDTSHLVRTDAARTALAFVQLDADGERHFSFYRPPAADLLFRDAHFHEASFTQTAVFHVCSNSMTEADIAQATLQGMARARGAGAVVSLDLNLRPALWPEHADPRPRLWSALMEADIVKLARNELDYLADATPGGEEAVVQRILEGHARLLVVTDGAATLQWHTRKGRGEVPAFKVRAVDTTAAGDAFVGGVLFHLAQRGIDGASFPQFAADAAAITEALRFGAAVGALAVTRQGAFAAMPAHAEVTALLGNDP